MSDNESNAGRSRVPAASFSRLSATRVVLGLDKAQLIVCVIGLAILVAGAAMGLNVPIMILGALVLAYGIPRIQGLSLVSWTWIWTHWRGRLKDGTNRWAYSPLASGRPLGVLGLYGHVEDRAQTIEGDGVEVVGTPFQGACYLWDPDKRQATAVLTANVEEWVLSSDRQKAGRAMALNTMLKELSETDGFVELKETSFVLPGHTPPEPEYLKDDRTPQWAREDLANLWHLPDILTPLQNSNYISVSVNADRLPHVVRKDRTERAAVGIAMGDLIRMTVAPALLDCGARRNTIHWCSPDDLRYLIRTIADPEHANDRPPVNRDDPTVTWVEEAKEHDYITLDSAVARSFWIYQWPDFDVQAGWIRDLVTDRAHDGVLPYLASIDDGTVRSGTPQPQEQHAPTRQTPGPEGEKPRRTPRGEGTTAARAGAGGQLAGHRPSGIHHPVRVQSARTRRVRPRHAEQGQELAYETESDEGPAACRVDDHPSPRHLIGTGAGPSAGRVRRRPAPGDNGPPARELAEGPRPGAAGNGEKKNEHIGE